MRRGRIAPVTFATAGLGSLMLAAVSAAVLAAALAAAIAGSAAAAAPPAGPPYPDAVTGQRVYDFAGIFSDSAISQAEVMIRRIEDRTGAQVAVYTQVKPDSDTESAAADDARALMDQWGVGRKGFDDGLVILFDMQDNLRHGQVNLYAGSGFRATYLTDSQRQSIFDNDMKPYLLAANFDAALASALSDVDQAATPEHAAALERARQVNAVIGLGALVLAVGLLLWAAMAWNRHGRDPIYIDDDSVLMPAPPPGLTPAMATLLMDDRCSSRTVSAGMIDLAAHGVMSFRDESGVLGHKAGLATSGRQPEPVGDAENRLADLIDAELASNDGYLEPDKLSKLATAVELFKSNLESAAVARGWLAGKPSSVVGRWIGLGVIEIVAGGVLIWWTLTSEASGGLLGGVPLIGVGVATMAIAYFMPARTRMGAMLNAMLHAYRRTLQKTMEMAQSMGEVVERKPLPWVTTPDATMAWGVAFGLQHELDAVLRRGFEQGERAGNYTAAWAPAWWVSSGSGGHGGGGGGGGMFSGSAIPDVGGMMAAIGSVGSSSSHSGGGGFGGGGGGGGGGAGGGF